MIHISIPDQAALKFSSSVFVAYSTMKILCNSGMTHKTPVTSEHSDPRKCSALRIVLESKRISNIS